MKLMEKELTHSKEQAIVTASHYAAVETDSNMLRNENRMYMRINHKLQIMTRKKEWSILDRIVQLLKNHKKN